MGNLRNLKRSIARNPDRVFMARVAEEKKKAGKDSKLTPEQQEAAKSLSKEIDAINKGD